MSRAQEFHGEGDLAFIGRKGHLETGFERHHGGVDQRAIHQFRAAIEGDGNGIDARGREPGREVGIGDSWNAVADHGAKIGAGKADQAVCSKPFAIPDDHHIRWRTVCQAAMQAEPEDTGGVGGDQA